MSRSDHSHKFSPECELILCCAATVLNNERWNRIKALLETDLDWDCLLKEAEQHGIIPLLYSNLEAAFPGAVPEPFINTLRDYFRKNLISNLLLTSEMCGILNLLEAHGISAVPFKGPTLAVAAYGDLALREFRDIDLLVHKEDVFKAKAILATRGYAPDHQLSRAQETAYLKSESEYGFRGSIYLELQWNIVPRNHSFKLNDDELWRHLDDIDIEGCRVAALSSEDLFLLLCAHGSKQSWKRLSLICDVAELIRASTDMDWSRLFERARRLGGERMLSTGLFLASSLSGAALPDMVLERVSADRTARTLGERACEQLFSKRTSFYEVVKNPLFFIEARERVGDKARCYFRMALSPTVNDLRSLSLPSSLYFLYYPLRPVRLLMKYLFRIPVEHGVKGQKPRVESQNV
jgi:hypothetical protein